MLTAPYYSQSLTANGQANGTVTVASTINYKLGAIAYLGGTGLPTITVKIVAILSTTAVQVQLVTNNVSQLNYGGSSVAAYTTAASSFLTQPQQDLSSHDYAIVSYSLSASTGQVVPTPTT